METKTKNTNSSKIIITVLITIIALLLIVIAALLWMLLGKSDGKIKGNIFYQGQNITVGNPDDKREAIEIVTKYGAFYYPIEWEKNLRTEIVDKDGYKVEFYGTVEGKEEQHLFDLFFNGSIGYNLGTLTTENGENVAINIESYSFDLDDTWTEDEEFVLYAMQDDINYMIGKLSESGNFVVGD